MSGAPASRVLNSPTWSNQAEAGPSRLRGRSKALDFPVNLSSHHSTSTLINSSKGHHRFDPIIIPDSDEEDNRPSKGLDRKAKGDSRVLRERHLQEQRERKRKKEEKGKERELGLKSSSATQATRTRQETDYSSIYSSAPSSPAFSICWIFDELCPTSPCNLPTSSPPSSSKMPVTHKSRSLASRDKSNLSSSSIATSSKRNAIASQPKAKENVAAQQRTLDSMVDHPRSSDKRKAGHPEIKDIPDFRDCKLAVGIRAAAAEADPSPRKWIPNPLRPLTDGKGLKLDDAIVVDDSDGERAPQQSARHATPTVTQTPKVVRTPKVAQNVSESSVVRLHNQSHSRSGSKHASPAKSTSSTTSTTPRSTLTDKKKRRPGVGFGSHLSPSKPHTSAAMTESDHKPVGRSGKTPTSDTMAAVTIKSLPPSQKEPSPKESTASPRKPYLDSPSHSRCRHGFAANKFSVSPLKSSVSLPAGRSGQKTTSRQRVVDNESHRVETVRRQALASPNSLPDRPKRSRPSEGTYVIPTMGATHWPSTPGTSSRPKRRRTKLKEEEPEPYEPRAGITNTPRTPRQELSAVELGSPLTSPEVQKKVFQSIESCFKSGLRSQSTAEEAAFGDDDQEVQEEVENEKETDLLAMYSDFDFLEPSPRPEEDAAEQAVEEPQLPTSMEVETSEDRLQPIPTAPPSQVGSISPASQSPSKEATDAAQLDTAALRAQTEAMRAEARRRAEEKQAERDRHLKELYEQCNKSNDEGESSGAEIDDIFNALQEDDSASEEVETVPETRQIRGTAKHEAQASVIEQGPNPLAALLRNSRRERKFGMDSIYYSDVLTSIRSSRETETYPSPESLPDTTEISMDAQEMRKLAKDLPKGLLDEGLIDELARTEEMEVETWTPFWMPEVIEACETPVPAVPKLRTVGIKGELLQSAIDREDFASILFMLSLPGSLSTLRMDDNARSLASWILLRIQHGEDDYVVLSYILCAQLSLACPHPFVCSKNLRDTLESILLGSGMSPQILMARPDHRPLSSRMDREAICDLVCSVAESAATNGRLEDTDACDLAHCMMLLAADTSTSSFVRRSVERVLPALFLRVGFSPADIARQLFNWVRMMQASLFARVRVLLSIGCRTQQQQAIMRWFAIMALLDDDLFDLSDNISVPPINLLEEGLHMIFKESSAPQPDHRKVKHWLVLFSESWSDIPALLASTGSRKEEFETFLKMILAAMHSISIRSFAKDSAGSNKARLGQLHVNLLQVMESAVLLKKRKDSKAMKGLELGTGGQTRLSLGQTTVPAQKVQVEDSKSSTGKSDGED